MSIKKDNEGNITWGLCRLIIDEELTIYTIENIKQALSADMGGYDKFELNLAHVEEIDSAGIQLLLAFKKELKLNNKHLTLTAMSSVVKNLIASYGVTARFNIGDAA